MTETMTNFVSVGITLGELILMFGITLVLILVNRKREIPTWVRLLIWLPFTGITIGVFLVNWHLFGKDHANTEFAIQMTIALPIASFIVWMFAVYRTGHEQNSNSSPT